MGLMENLATLISSHSIRALKSSFKGFHRLIPEIESKAKKIYFYLLIRKFIAKEEKIVLRIYNKQIAKTKRRRNRKWILLLFE